MLSSHVATNFGGGKLMLAEAARFAYDVFNNESSSFNLRSSSSILVSQPPTALL